MAKVSKSAAALSHTIAFAYELLENRGLDQDTINAVDKKMCEATNLKALLATTKDYRVEKELKGFYDAMLKVVPFIECPEHCGTEDRNWYRVWGDIVLNDGYFCEFDFGRDAYMAYTFFEHGAITEEQFNLQRVKNTLRLAACTIKNGRPDVQAMIEGIRQDWLDRVFDRPILNALELANTEQGRVLSVLAI